MIIRMIEDFLDTHQRKLSNVSNNSAISVNSMENEDNSSDEYEPIPQKKIKHRKKN